MYTSKRLMCFSLLIHLHCTTDAPQMQSPTKIQAAPNTPRHPLQMMRALGCSQLIFHGQTKTYLLMFTMWMQMWRPQASCQRSLCQSLYADAKQCVARVKVLPMLWWHMHPTKGRNRMMSMDISSTTRMLPTHTGTCPLTQACQPGP